MEDNYSWKFIFGLALFLPAWLAFLALIFSLLNSCCGIGGGTYAG